MVLFEKKIMQYQNLLLENKDTQMGVSASASVCCGLLSHQKRHVPLSEQPVSSILSNLQQLKQIRNLKLAQMLHNINEEELKAKQCFANRDELGARHRAGLIVQFRKNREDAYAKYSNLCILYIKLQQAVDNAVMAKLILSASSTLANLVKNTNGLENVLDELREQMYLSDEQSSVLAEPLIVVDLDVEESVEKMRDEMQEREAIEMEMKMPAAFVSAGTKKEETKPLLQKTAKLPS